MGASRTRWDRETDCNDAPIVCLSVATLTPPFPSEGATRSHLDLFKKHRAARIDHYVIEVNKLIIRLEKVRLSQHAKFNICCLC